MNKINLIKKLYYKFFILITILADKCNKFRIYVYRLKSINSIDFKFRFIYTVY